MIRTSTKPWKSSGLQILSAGSVFAFLLVSFLPKVDAMFTLYNPTADPLGINYMLTLIRDSDQEEGQSSCPSSFSLEGSPANTFEGGEYWAVSQTGNKIYRNLHYEKDLQKFLYTPEHTPSNETFGLPTDHVFVHIYDKNVLERTLLAPASCKMFRISGDLNTDRSFVITTVPELLGNFYSATVTDSVVTMTEIEHVLYDISFDGSISIMMGLGGFSSNTAPSLALPANRIYGASDWSDFVVIANRCTIYPELYKKSDTIEELKLEKSVGGQCRDVFPNRGYFVNFYSVTEPKRLVRRIPVERVIPGGLGTKSIFKIKHETNLVSIFDTMGEYSVTVTTYTDKPNWTQQLEFVDGKWANGRLSIGEKVIITNSTLFALYEVHSSGDMIYVGDYYVLDHTGSERLDIVTVKSVYARPATTWVQGQYRFNPAAQYVFFAGADQLLFTTLVKVSYFGIPEILCDIADPLPPATLEAGQMFLYVLHGTRLRWRVKVTIPEESTGDSTLLIKNRINSNHIEHAAVLDVMSFLEGKSKSVGPFEVLLSSICTYKVPDEAKPYTGYPQPCKDNVGEPSTYGITVHDAEYELRHLSSLHLCRHIGDEFVTEINIEDDIVNTTKTQCFNNKFTSMLNPDWLYRVKSPYFNGFIGNGNKNDFENFYGIPTCEPNNSFVHFYPQGDGAKEQYRIEVEHVTVAGAPPSAIAQFYKLHRADAQYVTDDSASYKLTVSKSATNSEETPVTFISTSYGNLYRQKAKELTLHETLDGMCRPSLVTVDVTVTKDNQIAYIAKGTGFKKDVQYAITAVDKDVGFCIYLEIKNTTDGYTYFTEKPDSDDNPGKYYMHAYDAMTTTARFSHTFEVNKEEKDGSPAVYIRSIRFIGRLSGQIIPAAKSVTDLAVPETVYAYIPTKLRKPGQFDESAAFKVDNANGTEIFKSVSGKQDYSPRN